MIRIGSPAAIDKQLDQLETVLNAFLVTVLVVLLAAANASKDFEIFGAKIETADAFGPVTYIFDGVFLVIASIVWKIADMLSACKQTEASDAIASLFIHKWIFNPFSFTGDRWASILNSCVGTGMFAMSWWAGLASLKLLSGVTSSGTKDATDLILVCLYLAFGLFASLICCRLSWILYKRIRDDQALFVPPNRDAFVKALRRSFVAKLLAFVIACVVGYNLFYAFGHVGA
jgi:hypothetical protein